MQKPQYRRLMELTQVHGDDFYRCMSDLVKNPSDSSTRKSCLENGIKYEAALTKQLEYLAKLPPGKHRNEAMAMCESYRLALSSQLRLLDRGASFDN